MRVLLVEDNRPLADWLAKALRQSRFVVVCMHDGADVAIVTLRGLGYLLEARQAHAKVA